MKQITLSQEAEDYLASLYYERNLSDNTIKSYRTDLGTFERWLDQGIVNSSRQDITRYLAHGIAEGRATTTRMRFLSCARGFFKHAMRKGLVTENPISEVESPKQARHLPARLSEAEVDALLNAPNPDASSVEFRDCVMLHVLYATGLRVSELVALRLEDVNLMNGSIRVIGKGNKERLIPLSLEAVEWIEIYVSNARPAILSKRRTDALFPSTRGKAMTRQTFWHAIKRYAARANIHRPLSPHTLRHAFATHLINHGAQLRVVQEFLGHASLNTTQIYTHVANDRKKELHVKHHPRG